MHFPSWNKPQSILIPPPWDITHWPFDDLVADPLRQHMPQQDNNTPMLFIILHQFLISFGFLRYLFLREASCRTGKWLLLLSFCVSWERLSSSHQCKNTMQIHFPHSMLWILFGLHRTEVVENKFGSRWEVGGGSLNNSISCHSAAHTSHFFLCVFRCLFLQVGGVAVLHPLHSLRVFIFYVSIAFLTACCARCYIIDISRWHDDYSINIGNTTNGFVFWIRGIPTVAISFISREIDVYGLVWTIE